jgi:imidazolonepropionase-like amidohydrolase
MRTDKGVHRFVRVVSSCLLLMVPTYTLGGAPEPENRLIVWAGTLLPAADQPPQMRRTLVVRGDRIERILAGFIAPGTLDPPFADVPLLDLSGGFVLPGLIDLHVHLTTDPSDASGLDEVTQTEADLALLAADNAHRTLAAGFTTVLDMGTGRLAHERAIYALRSAVAAGRLPGPEILAVGSPISAPGSSRVSRYVAPVDAVLAAQGVCSGADDCRRAVREQIARGADVVNFYNSGSLLAKASPAQTFTAEEMEAIVATAHALNRPVIADGGNSPTSAAGINTALRAGVDAIDTATYPDADTWRQLAKRPVYYVPHLYALQAAVGDNPDTLTQGSMGWLPMPILEKLFALKQARPAAAKAYAERVPMALGSDAGVFPHGDNARELLEYVRLGLTPGEALATATINAAAVLRLSADRGRLEPGMRADFIAVRGNPLQDIQALLQVDTVVRNGRVAVSGSAGAQP